MANTTAALIQNWSTVEDVIKSTQNAAGSADAENEKYLNSIEGKLAQFQAQFQKTSVDILNSDWIKNTVGTGSGILSFLDSVINKLGLLPGLITPVLSLLASSQNLNLFSTKLNDDGTTGVVGIWTKVKDMFAERAKKSEYDLGILQKYVDAKKKLEGANFEDFFEGVGENVKASARKMSFDSQGEIDAAQQKMKTLRESMSKMTSVGAKVSSVFKNIGAAAASMALEIAAAAAIQAVVTGLITVIDGLHMSAQEAAEVTKNAIDEYTKAGSEIDNNISSIDNLRDRFEELSKGVSDNGKNISLSADQYKEYQDIVSKLVDINPSLIRGYNDEQQAIIDKNNAI